MAPPSFDSITQVKQQKSFNIDIYHLNNLKIFHPLQTDATLVLENKFSNESNKAFLKSFSNPLGAFPAIHPIYHYDHKTYLNQLDQITAISAKVQSQINEFLQRFYLDDDIKQIYFIDNLVFNNGINDIFNYLTNY